MSVDGGRGDSPLGTHEGDDDDALSWGPSSDKSYVEGPATPRTVTVDEPDDDDELPEGVMSSTMLVVHGVFGGVFLLFTVAWLISAGRATAPSIAGIQLAMWHLGQYLAVVAAPLWFVGVIALTPLKPARRRLVWLAIGVAVLIPWPLLVGTAS